MYKIAYCLFGKPINANVTFENIRTNLKDLDKMDFYIQSEENFIIPDDIHAKAILIQNLKDKVEMWMALYKQLPIMHDWPLPRGVIFHLLSLDSVIKQILCLTNIDNYDLIVFSHWKASIESPINLVDWLPLSSPHFPVDLITYAPNPLFMAMDSLHAYNFVDLTYHLYNWLIHKDQLEFPWGMVGSWPNRYNWGLVLAQYLADHGIICHHRPWPITLTRETMILLN